MQVPRFTGLVRVTNSREEIEEATRLAIEKRAENYSPEALVLAIDELLKNLQLSRAIVVYVQSSSDNESNPGIERPFSWFSVLSSLAFAVFCVFGVFFLFRMVQPASSIWGVILIVIGQAILFRFAHRSARLAVMAACDGLNNASYPTKLHPLKNASSAVGTMRLRRLRALVLETADRIIAGEKASNIETELSEVNLTPQASRWIVRLAGMNAVLRDYLPPYQSRWLGLMLAIAFVLTMVIGLDRVGDRLAEGYQNYAIAVAAWIAGDLAARPRRRRPNPGDMSGPT